MKGFQKCRRRAWLSNRWSLDRDKTAANIGTVCHARLATYYSGEDMWDAEAEESWGALDIESRTTAMRMFDTYVIECEQDGLDVGQSTQAVEKRWTHTTGGLALSGKVDHIYHDEARGGLVIQDHKTVGQYHQTSPRDFQLMCYAWLAQREGYENIVAIEHNQIKRNKRTAQAKPPFINRTWQPVTDRGIRSFGAMLSTMAFEYRHVMLKAQNVDHPQVWAIGSNDCSYSCSFVEVCGMIDDGEDFATVLETEYQREVPVDIT